MNAKVLLAVFKRNLLAYFTSPTGYVFICVFVSLSSVAAFLPGEFFNRNLANLDQLNHWFPFIMLVFVPAITMGIWAEERRQGTDELLLTIPASDLDVVLAKYLAAVAIYSVSLAFSMICNVAVLKTLGSPDIGLFIGTYVGYWFVGLAMLAVGMVASFATPNLTIAYILGALFNVPLIALVWAEWILPESAGALLREWSIGEQLGEFGRGILSLSTESKSSRFCSSA
jgi:gliding motility-associated transport system permease protein/gliding motility-associatede transport system auxiliary component